MRKKRSFKKPNRKFYRKNERIFAKELRVLDAQGKQIGIVSKQEALSMAEEQGLDVVEIAPLAKPPVAKLIDFSKFLYQQKKKEKEEKRKSASSETKQLRFGPFIDDHDLQVKLKKAKDFLEEGNKVKFAIRFKGRQIVRKEAGFEVLDRVKEELSEVAKVEREAKMEGRQLVMLLSRLK